MAPGGLSGQSLKVSDEGKNWKEDLHCWPSIMRAGIAKKPIRPKVGQLGNVGQGRRNSALLSKLRPHTKGYLIKADIYLNCAREIAADGEGKLLRQCNK